MAVRPIISALAPSEPRSCTFASTRASASACCLLSLILTPGQCGDAPLAPALLDDLSPRRVLADKAYDYNALRDLIDTSSPNRHSLQPDLQATNPPPLKAYKVRNTIKRCFNKLNFRRIATRFYRRAAHFLGFLKLAAALLGIR